MARRYTCDYTDQFYISLELVLDDDGTFTWIDGATDAAGAMPSSILRGTWTQTANELELHGTIAVPPSGEERAADSHMRGTFEGERKLVLDGREYMRLDVR
jgi:hypothetical protein